MVGQVLKHDTQVSVSRLVRPFAGAVGTIVLVAGLTGCERKVSTNKVTTEPARGIDTNLSAFTRNTNVNSRDAGHIPQWLLFGALGNPQSPLDRNPTSPSKDGGTK